MQEKQGCSRKSIEKPTIYLYSKKADQEACSKGEEEYLSKGILSTLGQTAAWLEYKTLYVLLIKDRIMEQWCKTPEKQH